MQGNFKGHAGKITGVSRADEFLDVFVDYGRKRSANARRAAVYGRAVVAGRIEKEILGEFNGYCWNGFILWQTIGFNNGNIFFGFFYGIKSGF